MRAILVCVLLLVVLLTAARAAPSRVAKRVIRGAAAGMEEKLVNGGFEAQGDADRPAASWGYWEKGYALERQVTRGGKAAARCSSTDPNIQYGAGQTVVLNQTQPLPIVAGGWSKATDVSGSLDGGYSVYVDLLYTDGTPLWGQITPFDTGTHDWQYREVVIVPERPVRELNCYGLFRGHTGTVYFDDFTVKMLALPTGAAVFDGVPVAVGGEAARSTPERLRIEAGGRSLAEVDRQTGALLGDGTEVGGFLLRDVAAGSDFLQPVCPVTVEGETTLRLEGECPELGLGLRASLALDGGMLRVTGEVKDAGGEDRAIAVYFVVPTDFTGGEFGFDMRHSLRIDPAGPNGATYSHMVSIGAGTNGKISRYPIAPVTKGDRALCIATPLDAPRVSRLAYDAASRELHAAFDLGLSAATKQSPSAATFSLLVYGFDPAWGFRAALAEYYRHFPSFFTKRVEKEGIWMPFTDIATVQDPMDFGFMFKEGNDNVAWDDAHGIYSFVYVEPMSHWLALAPAIPRTYDASVTELQRVAAGDSHAQATLQSAFQRPDGGYDLSVLDTPWCNGALFINNPNPALLADQPNAMTQAKWLLASVDGAFRQTSQAGVGAWRGYGAGFEPDGEAAHSGKWSARCTNKVGEEHGATQAVLLGQKEPKDIVVRAWSRAEGVTGEKGNDYSLYVDLTYVDGTPSFGHVTPFEVGTHRWEQAEVLIHPEKPIQTMAVNLLLRRQNAGTAWFDDVFVAEPGSDQNLAKNEGFEPPGTPEKPAELDGTYLDSFEMASTDQNYRREHWAYDDIPLTFSLGSRKVCSLGIFHAYGFEREIARRMHEQGKLLFANGVLWNYSFPAPPLDVLGTETNWAQGGKYVPESDEIMNFRRALCYQKPYLLLLNTDYKAFRPEWVELYFKRCAFYAVFPSFFSHNAADDPYWQNPALYNRDRPLFRKYIPLIATLSAAGWEPVTGVRVESEGKVYIERYGSDLGKGVYLALLNDGDQAAEYALKMEAVAPLTSVARAHDLLTGDDLAVTKAGERVTIKGVLEPQGVRVLRVS